MDILERLKNVFDSVFDGQISTENMGIESDLRNDVGMNSIGMLYMAMALEEEFSIKFTNDDFTTLRTVGDVIECIKGKL